VGTSRSKKLSPIARSGLWRAHAALTPRVHDDGEVQEAATGRNVGGVPNASSTFPDRTSSGRSRTTTRNASIRLAPDYVDSVFADRSTRSSWAASSGWIRGSP
jgi:hypothetical protein